MVQGERTDAITGAAKSSGLQALRGAAALAVVTYHAVPGFSFGQAGVDVFFVISGFIMVYTSARLFGQPGAPRAFFARRLIRIVPLYWATSAVLLIEILLRYGNLDAAGTSTMAAVASFFFIPWAQPDGSISPLHAVGWTLNFEMLFYCLFAAVVVLPKPRALLSVTLGLAALCVGGMVWPDPPTVVRYWSRPLVIEFAFGIAVAEIVGRVAPDRRLALGVLAGGIAVAAACALFLPTPFGSNEWIRVLAAGVPAAFLVCAIVLAGEPKHLRPAMAFLGDLSYPLYLTHPLTLAALAILIPGLWAHRAASGFIEAAFLIGAALVVATAAYILLDRPVTNALRSTLARQVPRRKHDAERQGIGQWSGLADPAGKAHPVPVKPDAIGGA
jgi:exopolysaccharide production protein ExoZ